MADVQLPGLCLGVPIDHRLEPLSVLDLQPRIPSLVLEAMPKQLRVMAAVFKNIE